MTSRESGGGEREVDVSNGCSGRHDVLLDGRDNPTALAVAQTAQNQVRTVLAHSWSP